MIKSTQTSIKFSNKNKLLNLYSFIDDYQDLIKQFIDILWEMDDIKPLCDKSITSKVKTQLSARIIQCAGKQASAIVRGARKKQSKRKYIIDKFNNEGKFKKARKLQAIYNKNIPSKPNPSIINPELDSRFIKIDLDNKTTFDG
jgi:hypothetical protein